MNVTRRGEDRLWAGAFALGIVGGAAWLVFEIGLVPGGVGLPGAFSVVLGGLTVVTLSLREGWREGGSVRTAAKRGVRTLWE